ncbi:MAG: hypothetical protein ACD_23C00495G0001, partial [uncultured bacterium]
MQHSTATAKDLWCVDADRKLSHFLV